MGSIQRLPPSLSSQIAAGEVVERPASAVKELVENSIDAGATRCEVEIEGGGIKRIAVIDDGRGMSKQDASISVERHATSKIHTLEQLGCVETFGFRGEALPSIASVSRFVVRTRTADDDEGVEVSVDGGSEAAARPVGAPLGTTVEVRDLFYNVPARRKFLRSSGTESGHVTDVVESAALSRPEMTFTLTRDGRRVREWLRAPDREHRVKSALSGEELAACRGDRGPLTVEAFLSRPERARSGAGGLRLLVNGRPVRDRALAHTVAQAYGSVLDRGRYPRGVVYLDIAPQLLDVNVHPQKAEVRFADPRAVSDALYRVLSLALSSAFSLPAPPRSQWSPKNQPQTAAAAPSEPAAGAAPVARIAAQPAASPTAADGASARSDAPGIPSKDPLVFAVRDSSHARLEQEPAVPWSSLRFLAQVRQTYLICEGDNGLYVLDQHAAAERVNFYRLRKAYESKDIASQAMLFPLTFDITPLESEMLEEHGEEFARVGFDVRVRGTELVSVHSVPKLLHRASPERMVRDLLAEITRTGGRAFSDAVDRALATMACHGSIRAGDPLTADEATHLLRSLDITDFAGHCPHGRPVVTYTSWAELERQVGRR